MDEKKRYQTFLGIYREVNRAAFFIKFLLLGITTTVFLSRNMPLMLGTLAAVLVLSLFLLGKNTLKVFKFLVLSTVVLTIVWIVFVGRIWSSDNFADTAWRMLESYEYHNALLRLYGMFLTGQLFLGVASQYELLASLRKIDAPASVFVMLVLMFNSVSYFIRSYSDIKTGYAMRCRKKESLKRAYYVFIALALEAMELISDCKKVYFLDAETDPEQSEKRKPLHEERKTEHCSHVLTVSLENILYYDRKEPVLRNISGTFESGQIYVIHGVNGAGKSTFLNAVSGVIPEIIRAEGKIHVDMDQSPAYGHIGYVPQGVEKSLFFDTPAACWIICRRKKRSLDRAIQLDRIDPECRTMGELSSGECKKFELIGEILNDAHEILLLDEPSAYLDEKSKKTLMELIESVKKERIILLVTHDRFLIRWMHSFAGWKKKDCAIGNRKRDCRKARKDRREKRTGKLPAGTAGSKYRISSENISDIHFQNWNSRGAEHWQYSVKMVQEKQCSIHGFSGIFRSSSRIRYA